MIWLDLVLHKLDVISNWAFVWPKKNWAFMYLKEFIYNLFDLISWYKYLYGCFNRTYKNSLCYVYKLFLAYFNKVSIIIYENNSHLIWKQFNLIVFSIIEIVYL